MKKPKIYTINVSDYDISDVYQFINSEVKTKSEFEKDCIDTLRENAEEFMQNHKSFIGTFDLIKLIADKLPLKGYIRLEEAFEVINIDLHGESILFEGCKFDKENKMDFKCFRQRFINQSF